jgi:hypothetical protein
MTAEEDEPSLDTDRRPVRRGEGEVSQWPRGLVEYVTRGPVDEGVPSEDEDRTGQRLRLASSPCFERGGSKLPRTSIVFAGPIAPIETGTGRKPPASWTI